MAGYCMSVWPYFHEPQVSENTAQECNMQPYCPLNHHLLCTTLILVASRNRQLLRMRISKVIAGCICNKLQAVNLFLALGGASTCTDPFNSRKRYHRLVNNAILIRNASLFLFQLGLAVHSN